MNVQKFLQKKEFETVEDFEYQAEYLAYVVAKHYNISLYDVYKMPLSIFKQSLIWAMAIQEEQEKEQEAQNEALTHFWIYEWDEAAYQADNTTGWVLTDLQEGA